MAEKDRELFDAKCANRPRKAALCDIYATLDATELVDAIDSSLEYNDLKG